MAKIKPRDMSAAKLQLIEAICKGQAISVSAGFPGPGEPMKIIVELLYDPGAMSLLNPTTRKRVIKTSR